MSKSVFELIKCQKLGPDDWVLEADTDYLCPSQAFGQAFVVGCTCFALVPIGIPLYIGSELYRNRDVINPGGDDALHALVPTLYPKQAAVLVEIDQRLDRIHKAIKALDENDVDDHLGDHAEHEGYGEQSTAFPLCFPLPSFVS